MRTLLSLMLLKLLSADAVAGATAAVAPAAPETAEAPAKKVKAEKPAAEKQNGIQKPSADTTCGRIWAIADALSAQLQRPAKRKEVIDAANAQDINPATASTQYGRWHRFWGIPAEPKVPPQNGAQKAQAEAAAAGKPPKAGKKGITVTQGTEALAAAEVETSA